MTSRGRQRASHRRRRLVHRRRAHAGGDGELPRFRGPSGLGYYGYRYYDPVTGRWPSRDATGEQGGVNLYQFANNVPCCRIDYLGNSPLLLNYEMKAPEFGTCGGFRVEIKWVVSPDADQKLGGVVLQEMNVSGKIWKSGNKENSIPIFGTRHYFEAWRVDEGATHIWPPLDGGTFHDRWRQGDEKTLYLDKGDDFSGEIVYESWARYRDKITEDLLNADMPLGTVDMAGPQIWSSWTRPQWHSPRSNLVHRKLTVSWCCEKASKDRSTIPEVTVIPQG